jgi:coenzyme PQQ biosynthesis protein PqqD
VNFARTQPWPIAVASSLTELFAPDLMATRLAAFEKYYSWIDSRGLDYFRRRVTQARRDSDQALAMTLDHCNTPELQREAVRALQFKCDVLWSMLDAIHHAYGPFPTIAGSAQPTLTRGVRLQTDPKTGNSVLLFPEGVLELNETAQEILTRCDGRTVSEIIQALAEEYDAGSHMLADDVRETLADLQRRKLIELT